ncbi:hypothetical protein [Algoriphagus sp.]|uniref:hypothetical protein n=1 Tax=Algoriphagus sp. TaxID=1872435 RepID=UPI00261AF256|nr:hypothetical protein [Algoriphagus sp.]
MKLILTLIILYFSLLQVCQSQVSAQLDTLSEADQKLIGIWRYDLVHQKQQAELLDKEKSKDNSAQEKLWKKIDSWSCFLDEERRYTLSWVENGSLFQEFGTWEFDLEKMMISLSGEKSIKEYRVTFAEVGMIWIPEPNSREDFNMLLLKKLGQ